MSWRLWSSVGLAAALASACQYSGEPLCQDRRCAAPGEPDAGGGACRSDVDCPLGAICDGTRCAAGCRSTRDCPPDQSCDTRHQPYGVCVGGAAGADASPAAADAGGGCTRTWIPLLVNGGFESGPFAGWVEHRGANDAIIVHPQATDTVQPHGGSYLAWIGYVATTESITQTFTIPADADALQVQGWWQIETFETTDADIDSAVLSLSVPSWKVLDLSNRYVMGHWLSFGETTSYALAPEERGVESTLTAKVVNSSASSTYLYLDDLTVLARVCR